jgi:16S rRNA C1402 N4-methylase RsmH
MHRLLASSWAGRPGKVSAAHDRARAKFSMYTPGSSCRDLQAALAELGLDGRADAILLDLGVSSMQLDDPARGFSFSADGPLDMRMDGRAAVTAADVINGASEQELGRVLREYGEERVWKAVSRRIVDARCARSRALLACMAMRVSCSYSMS